MGICRNCQILPTNRQVVTDEASGVRITLITTNKSDDTNLYFNDRYWLLDQGVMLFISDRTGRNEIYGYISDTGDIRIVSAGAWMEGIEAYELYKVNWWHASGSRDGPWMAAVRIHMLVETCTVKVLNLP